jgi:hypothetical protein
MSLTGDHKVRLSRSVGEIVREFFPDADDEEVETILWSETGWPGFWAGDPETCLRGQLASYRAAIARGTRLCDFCHEDAAEGSSTCAGCGEGLRRAREAVR